MLDYSCFRFEDLRLSQLYDLLALRQKVFIVEQDCPYLDADGKDAASYHVLGCNGQGRLLAYTRFMPPGISYPTYSSLGRVVTDPSIRRSGEGRRLMQETMGFMRSILGEGPVKISAQCYLIDFYQSLGFSTYGEQYLEDNIPHISMLRQLGA